MDNLNELGLKFGEGTVWYQKHKCGWCEKTPIHYTYHQYLLKGNICNKCSSMINDTHIDTINEGRKKKLEEKKELLDTLGKSLNQNMSEEDRQKIEELMKTIHAEIIYTEAALDSGM